MRKLLTIGSFLFLAMLACLAEHERDLYLSPQHDDHAHLPTVDLVISALPERPSLLDFIRIPAPPAPDLPAHDDPIAAIHRHLIRRCTACARQQLRASAGEHLPRRPLLSIMHRMNARHPSSEDDPPLPA